MKVLRVVIAIMQLSHLLVQTIHRDMHSPGVGVTTIQQTRLQTLASRWALIDNNDLPSSNINAKRLSYNDKTDMGATFLGPEMCTVIRGRIDH